MNTKKRGLDGCAAQSSKSGLMTRSLMTYFPRKRLKFARRFLREKLSITSKAARRITSGISKLLTCRSSPNESNGGLLSGEHGGRLRRQRDSAIWNTTLKVEILRFSRSNQNPRNGSNSSKPSSNFLKSHDPPILRPDRPSLLHRQDPCRRTGDPLPLRQASRRELRPRGERLPEIQIMNEGNPRRVTLNLRGECKFCGYSIEFVSEFPSPFKCPTPRCWLPVTASRKYRYTTPNIYPKIIGSSDEEPTKKP